MVEIKVYNDIAGEDVLMLLGGKHDVFSAEKVKDIFAGNPDEKDFKFDINCNGGSVHEGFAIYDIIRTSGKNIYCNIDGACHSMALTLLLAAPAQNRTANPNAIALIHDVRTWAGDVTADSAATLAEELKRERERILNVYTERTKLPKNKLEAIMLEEKERNVKELLQWGFISRINNYNTNKKIRKMSKNVWTDFVNKTKDFFNSFDAFNYSFTDADGNFLFETEQDDDTLEVGMAASPDGKFDLPDGRTVVIEKGCVTEITEPPGTIEELNAKITGLQAQLNKSNELLKEATRHIENLANIKSKFNVKPRENVTKDPLKRANIDIKNEIRKNLGKKEKENK